MRRGYEISSQEKEVMIALLPTSVKSKLDNVTNTDGIIVTAEVLGNPVYAAFFNNKQSALSVITWLVKQGFDCLPDPKPSCSGGYGIVFSKSPDAIQELSTVIAANK